MTGGIRVLELGKVNSTNSYLLERSEEFKSGFTVFSTEQISGRGRLGRDWVGVPGKSLAVSCLVEPPPDGVAPTWLPLLAGLSAHTTVEALGAIDVMVKWPNDLIVGRRKLAGILVEGATDGRFVVGMGMNVSLTVDSHPVASSISLGELDCTISDVSAQVVEPWVKALLASLDEALVFPASTVNAHWRALVESHLDTIGRTVRVQSSSTEEITGIAQGLSQDGGLVLSLQEPGEEIVIHSGDVFHIPRS